MGFDIGGKEIILLFHFSHFYEMPHSTVCNSEVLQDCFWNFLQDVEVATVYFHECLKILCCDKKSEYHKHLHTWLTFKPFLSLRQARPSITPSNEQIV